MNEIHTITFVDDPDSLFDIITRACAVPASCFDTERCTYASSTRHQESFTSRSSFYEIPVGSRVSASPVQGNLIYSEYHK